MEEVWKYIPKTYHQYSVSNLGRVRSNQIAYTASNGVAECVFHKKGRILKPHANKEGYLSVNLFGKPKKIHRLVAEVFIENSENKPCINHKDGNKSNNSIDNLEWVTVKENNLHALENGLRPSGERYSHSKLTDAQVREIRANYKPRTRGCGCKVLARKYGVHHSIIQKILNKQMWRYLDVNS